MATKESEITDAEMTRRAFGATATGMWNRALELAAKHFPHTDLQGRLVCDCGMEVGSAGKWYQHILSFQYHDGISNG